MPLTLIDVRRIATDVARQQHSALEVVAATPAEGESSYAEVILMLSSGVVEPSRVVIGVRRDASEPECRRAVQERLQEYLARQ